VLANVAVHVIAFFAIGQSNHYRVEPTHEPRVWMSHESKVKDRNIVSLKLRGALERVRPRFDKFADRLAACFYFV
jgi:hypothetical protein